MDEMKKLVLMNNEHDAWLVVVARLKKLYIDINEQPELNEAIVDWGEELATLRSAQGAPAGDYEDTIRERTEP